MKEPRRKSISKRGKLKRIRGETQTRRGMKIQTITITRKTERVKMKVCPSICATAYFVVNKGTQLRSV